MTELNSKHTWKIIAKRQGEESMDRKLLRETWIGIKGEGGKEL